MIMVITDRYNNTVIYLFMNRCTVWATWWRSFKKEIWSACSHTCKPKHASSITAVRTRRVTCVDDKKRIVQVQLCEQTAEKPVDTEVKPSVHSKKLWKFELLLTHFFIRTFRAVRISRIVQINGNLDHGVSVNAPIVLLVLVLVNRNDRLVQGYYYFSRYLISKNSGELYTSWNMFNSERTTKKSSLSSTTM